MKAIAKEIAWVIARAMEMATVVGEGTAALKVPVVVPLTASASAMILMMVVMSVPMMVSLMVAVMDLVKV